MKTVKKNSTSKITKSEVGIFVLTHGRQGESLLDVASQMLSDPLSEIQTLNLLGTERCSEIKEKGRKIVDDLLKTCKGVLILSDLFGSTPAKIAEEITKGTESVACLHGINLVMLLEAVNMRYLPLQALQKQVATTTKKSIIGCQSRL